VELVPPLSAGYFSATGLGTGEEYGIRADASGEGTSVRGALLLAGSTNSSPIGVYAQAIIPREIENNHRSIKTDKPNVKVSWHVTGIRQDAWAESNRIQVEVEKRPEEKGKYLHPEAFGKPVELSVDFERIRSVQTGAGASPIVRKQ